MLGGSKSEVMINKGKLAIEKKGAAGSFVKANGGSLTIFYGAIKAAYENSRMIREKRTMKNG